MKARIILIASLLSALSCGNTPSRQTAAQADTSQTGESAAPCVGYPIDYDTTPVLKTVFVTDHNGLQARQEADSDSEVLVCYEYGDQLEVIELAGSYYYGIRDRISRQFEEEHQTIVSNGWEKIYIPKAGTGTSDQIGLCAEDLNLVVSSSENIDGEMRQTFYDQPQPLGKHLTIELINKQLYNQKKGTAISFLLADTTRIVKTDGRITLPCLSKPVEYTDIESEGDSFRSYTYRGRIDTLNCYVIDCSYYENWDMQLVDKTDGKTISMVGYPHVSPDLKYVISLRENPYDGTADLELYAIHNQRIGQGILFASFSNWMPISDSTDKLISWGSDNYLYAAVNHTKAYWTPDGMYNDHHQYIRIKIVEP